MRKQFKIWHGAYRYLLAVYKERGYLHNSWHLLSQRKTIGKNLMLVLLFRVMQVAQLLRDGLCLKFVDREFSRNIGWLNSPQSRRLILPTHQIMKEILQLERVEKSYFQCIMQRAIYGCEWKWITRNLSHPRVIVTRQLSLMC